MMVHSSEPPKVGRVAARARVLGSQGGGHRAGQVTALRCGAQQHDLGLVLVDQVGQALGEGLVAVALEHRVAHDVDVVRTKGEGVLGEGVQVFIGATQHHATQRRAQLVGQLAAFAQQLPRHAVRVATLVLDEHPHAFVGLQLIGQFQVAATASGLQGGFGFTHGGAPRGG
jgi:hypothetical protein